MAGRDESLPKLALALAPIGQPTAIQAAVIYVAGSRWTGIPAIWINGRIVPGDDRRFATLVNVLHRALMPKWQCGVCVTLLNDGR